MIDAKTFPAALDAERAEKVRGRPPGDVPGAGERSGRQTVNSPPSPPSSWLALCATLARATQRAFARPKVRLTALGSALLLAAAFIVTGSAWTAPLAIVGILALVVAWFGSRLNGRLVLEWSESGVGFELKAGVVAPQRPSPEVKAVAAPRGLEAVSDDALVIESTATTVEIDVAELKALIALAEAA